MFVSGAIRPPSATAPPPSPETSLGYTDEEYLQHYPISRYSLRSEVATFGLVEVPQDHDYSHHRQLFKMRSGSDGTWARPSTSHCSQQACQSRILVAVIQQSITTGPDGTFSHLTMKDKPLLNLYGHSKKGCEMQLPCAPVIRWTISYRAFDFDATVYLSWDC